jgi:transcription elongation GreA/GreB family factor
MVSGLALGLTVDGMQQLANELAAFQERRATLAEALATSPDDLGELQGEMAQIDRRIAEIETVLARAQPIDDADRVPGVVGLGSRVTVRWEADGEETYTIVEPVEVALSAGRISYESPVGQALMERRAGDGVAVETIAGPAWLEIIVVD